MSIRQALLRAPVALRVTSWLVEQPSVEVYTKHLVEPFTQESPNTTITVEATAFAAYPEKLQASGTSGDRRVRGARSPGGLAPSGVLSRPVAPVSSRRRYHCRAASGLPRPRELTTLQTYGRITTRDAVRMPGVGAGEAARPGGGAARFQEKA